MGRDKLSLVLFGTFLILQITSATEDSLEVSGSSQEIELSLDDGETLDLTPAEAVAVNDEEIITLQDVELFQDALPVQTQDEASVDDAEEEENTDDASSRSDRKMNNANAKREKVNKLRPAAKKGEPRQRISPTIASEETNQVVDTFIQQLNELHGKNAARHLVAVANLQVPSLNKKNQKNQRNQLRRDRIFLTTAFRADLNNGYVKYSIGEIPTNYEIERKLSTNSSSIDFESLERQQLGKQQNKNRFNAVISGLDRMERNGDITVVSREKVQVLRVPVLLGPVELEFRPSVNHVLRESRVSSSELAATLILKKKGATFKAGRLVRQPARGRAAQQILIRDNLDSREKEERLVSHLSLEMQRLWNRGILVGRTNKQIRQYFLAQKKTSNNATKN